MNIRSTLLMFALSIGALWLFGLMLAYKRTNVEEGLILPSFKAVADGDIEKVTLQFREDKQSQDLEFYQDAGTWTFGKNKIRVDGFKIRKILDELKSAVKNDEERVPPNSVDNPRIMVTIQAKGNKSWQVKIGKSTAEKSMDFVKTSDLPQAVAVAHAQIVNLFFTDVNEFRSTQPFNFSEASVKRIDIKQAGDTAKKDSGKELEIKRTDEDLWKVIIPKDIGYAAAEGQKPKETPPPKTKKPFDDPEKDKDKDVEVTGGVKLLLKNIKALSIDTEDFIPAINDIDLSKYGLADGTEQLRIDVSTSGVLGKDETKDVTLLIGSKDPEKDKYFARMKGDYGVFKLSGKSLEPIRKALNNPEELRSRDIIFTKADKLDLIRLKDKNEYLLAHPAGKSWSMFFAGKWVEANNTAVDSLLKALDTRDAILGFPAGSDSELGLDQPRITMFLTADAKPKEEKKPVPETKKEEKKDDKEPKKDAKVEEKFALDAEPGVLERKDWTTEATFKNGKAATVANPDEKLVKAEVVDGKVKFTQTGEADKDDKTLDFKIKGGKDGKEEVDVKVTVRKKPAVTLIFGKLQSKKVDDKEVWSVKRILDDGTEHRFYLSKELVDKIIPSDVYLAFLDSALPVFSDDDMTGFTLDRNLDKKKENLVLYRTKDRGWLFKNDAALPSENVADADRVLGAASAVGRMRAAKWVQEIDAKTDLKQFGLDQPRIMAIVVVKKAQPITVASAVSMLGSGGGWDLAVLACGESLKDWCDDAKGQPVDKGQTVTVRFGKEGEKDGVKGVYALYTVEESKDAAKKDDKVKTNDLLFLADFGVFNGLKVVQFHDRSEVVSRQTFVDLAAVGGGPGSLLAYGPFLNPTLLEFDVSKVEKISLETRQQELRKFTFSRDQKAPAKTPEKKEEGKENKESKESKDSKEKDKDKDKANEPVSLKGQTWKDDSGLPEFNLDSEHVNELIEKLAKVQTKKDDAGNFVAIVRLASYDGPRAYQKLGAKECTIKMEIFLEGKQAPITVYIGARIRDTIGSPGLEYHFAHSSTRPQEVFLVRARFIDEILSGTQYFGVKSVTE